MILKKICLIEVKLLYRSCKKKKDYRPSWSAVLIHKKNIIAQYHDAATCCTRDTHFLYIKCSQIGQWSLNSKKKIYQYRYLLWVFNRLIGLVWFTILRFYNLFLLTL